ncbi:MAG: hypothetical protein HEQ12_06485 [Aphanizomenon flos-aquae DEX188]|jgi:hypothetical protein|nr:MAG: hypothetical protein HEQ12_06485 [Aphanizomenon flos-aquae DEX188]
MLEVIMFETSTPPAKINIDYFFNKIVAFYEVTGCEGEEYLFFYNGTAENIKGFLSTVGFENIKIIEPRPYSDFEGYMLQERIEND